MMASVGRRHVQSPADLCDGDQLVGTDEFEDFLANCFHPNIIAVAGN